MDDPTANPLADSEYDHRAIEARGRALWGAHDIYRFDPDAAGPVFSVDTPPPYVSASHLHVGHAMSYSQPDFIIRYRRMRGERIFYPMGFDDNGLPTERYVEQKHGIRSTDLPRPEFVRLCLTETRATADRYTELWQRLGLSVDWSLRYSTIEPRSQHTAQASFIKLYEAGHVSRAADPILWCPECRTALAQADVEDLTRTGQLHQLTFAGPQGRPLVIATTRPELLPACVALYCHPEDPRYASLVGDRATVPRFGHEVPIKADEAVDPDFGTGLLMVCTFGDGEDVLRWRRDGLDLRLVVTEDGRLNERAGEFAGTPLTAARPAIISALAAAGALGARTPVRQVVGAHERCGTPVEFQLRPQWFLGIRAHRAALRRRAAELTWIPPFMRRRLEDWIDGLKWDWNLSRQRRYGTPFPAWFCRDCTAPVLASLDSLPVDPLSQPPPTRSCPECGGGELDPDPDVMDTWLTSSLSPQLNAGWVERGFAPPAPMTLRVQAFEIIRTWLFYTLVQSELHFGQLPWTTVMISGHGLNEQGQKISKRELGSAEAGFNRYLPDHVLDRYGADALRLWATKARVGTDLRYHEKDVRAGRKLAVKLWNVARFLTRHGAGPDPRLPVESLTPVDRWLLSHLADALDTATGHLDDYDATAAYQATARFFWSIYCDRYLEMIKGRFLDGPDETGAASARTTLWASFRVVLGMFAPFAPFVTEELYQRLYRAGAERAGDDAPVSLHLTGWPRAEPRWRGDRGPIDQLAKVLDRVRALRSGLRLGSGTRLDTLVLHPTTPVAAELAEVIAEPLRVAARADQVIFGEASQDSGVPGLAVALRVRPDR